MPFNFLDLAKQIFSPDYKSLFTPNMEKEFQAWHKKRAKKLGLNPDPDNPNHFYDYRGAWLKGHRTITGHLPDTYKLPGHPTFSTESIYYQPGMKAIKWQDEQPIPFEVWNRGW